jgi:hypothetical protein
MEEIDSKEYYKCLNLIENYEKELNYRNYYNDLTYYYTTILKD